MLADDVLQEAYTRFLRAGMKDAAIGQVRSYLYKTVRTLVADHGRRVDRERRRQQRWESSVSESPRHDLTLDMERLFVRLSEKERTLLWLAYVEGASHRDIAASLGMREALRWLQKWLASAGILDLPGFASPGPLVIAWMPAALLLMLLLLFTASEA